MNPLPDAIRAAVLKWDEDRQDDWQERAAMIQYGDCVDRETAEKRAYFQLRQPTGKAKR